MGKTKTLVRDRSKSARIQVLQFILLVLVTIISYGALILPFLYSTTVSLQPGEVAPNDFQAPQEFNYISEVRTEEERSRAASGVTAIYTLPDPTIARNQIERLRAALQYISLVRDDENSTPEQKR